MKKYLLILSLFVTTAFTAFAQDGDNDERGNKLQERMREYIQKRLHLSRNEAERFSPLFFRYLNEVRRVHRENASDIPLRQLRVAEVRIQFRNEFKQIFDEDRANKVFRYEIEFQDKVRDELKNRAIENRRGPNRRFRSLMQ